MFKRIKRYFKLKKQIQHEVLETLITICLHLAYKPGSRNIYTNYLYSHATMLKDLSAQLRKQLAEEPKEEAEFLTKKFNFPE